MHHTHATHQLLEVKAEGRFAVKHSTVSMTGEYAKQGGWQGQRVAGRGSGPPVELQGVGRAGQALHASREGRRQKSKRTSFVPVSSPGQTGGLVTAGNHMISLTTGLLMQMM